MQSYCPYLSHKEVELCWSPSVESIPFLAEEKHLQYWTTHIFIFRNLRSYNEFKSEVLRHSGFRNPLPACGITPTRCSKTYLSIGLSGMPKTFRINRQKAFAPILYLEVKGHVDGFQFCSTPNQSDFGQAETLRHLSGA